MRRAPTQVGLGSAARRTVFINAVEKGAQRVVIAVRDGIELVRVALCAAQGQSHPSNTHGVDPINHIVHPRLFLVASALAIGHVVAMKAGGQLPGWPSLWQQITRELQQGETVEGQIGIESLHHPIAPRPIAARGITLEPIRVGIPRQIQPPHGHALAKMRRGQKTIHRPRIQHLALARRQAGQVQTQATQQSLITGSRRQLHALALQSFTHPKIHHIPLTRLSPWCLQRPMPAPRRTLVDPLRHQLALLRTEPRLVRAWRRHHFVNILTDQPLPQLTLRRLPRPDHRQGALAGVQPQLGLAMRLILPVAGQTMF